MKILFITAHRLGDAVISLGALHGLMRRYPEARFTIACGPAVVELFEHIPRCTQILPLHKKSWNRHWMALWGRCVRQCWDLVVDLRSSLVGFGVLARKRQIVPGGRRPGLKLLQHAKALGLVGHMLPLPRLWVGQKERLWAEAYLPAHQKWFALAPTAGTPHKMWSGENFAALGRRWQLLGYTPIVLYGPGERERALAAALVKALPDAWDLGGKHNLGQVSALLARCSLFVGNDSGLMHLAAAAGIPTLGLFGPSCASQYAPSGRRARALSAPGPEGAGKMEALGVEEVFAASQALLG